MAITVSFNGFEDFLKVLYAVHARLEEDKAPAFDIFLEKVRVGLQERIKKAAPQNSGKLKRSLKVKVHGQAFNWELITESPTQYATWVAKGTTDSWVEGQVITAKEFTRNGFLFKVSKSSPGSAYKPGDSFPQYRWHGQEAQNFDEKGYLAYVQGRKWLYDLKVLKNVLFNVES